MILPLPSSLLYCVATRPNRHNRSVVAETVLLDIGVRGAEGEGGERENLPLVQWEANGCNEFGFGFGFGFGSGSPSILEVSHLSAVLDLKGLYFGAQLMQNSNRAPARMMGTSTFLTDQRRPRGTPAGRPPVMQR